MGGGSHLRLRARSAGGQPAVDGGVEASQTEERSDRCQQVGQVGASGSEVVAPDPTPQSGSAAGSGGVTSPRCLSGGADGADQCHARTGEEYGPAAPQEFEPELCTKGGGGSSRRDP